MSPELPRHLTLREHECRHLGLAWLASDEADHLWREHGKHVSVEFPSPKTDGGWELLPLNWVGYIPLPSGRIVCIEPKVPIHNLFGMIEVAYRLRRPHLQFLDGVIACQSLVEFYEVLAGALAKRVLARGRCGFYRSYLDRHETLPFVRGRLDLAEALRAPWRVTVPCEHNEHTGDIDDNRILAWTLAVILRTGWCSDRTLPMVRQAFHLIGNAAEVGPQEAQACIGRLYTRLNDDYEPMHGLCRFFLEGTGPSWHRGDHCTVPFLVEMPRLFEACVSVWLSEHVPEANESLRIERHAPIDIGPLHLDVDLVLHGGVYDEPLAVLDVKYKWPETAAPEDVYQVVAYAEALGCEQAVLIYPAALRVPLDVQFGRIRVRSVCFDLNEYLDQAGEGCIANILRGFQGNGHG